MLRRDDVLKARPFLNNYLSKLSEIYETKQARFFTFKPRIFDSSLLTTFGICSDFAGQLGLPIGSFFFLQRFLNQRPDFIFKAMKHSIQTSHFQS